MPGRGARVGVIVVTIREIGAMVEQQPETAFPPLVAIALQIIAAKLVDDDNDHQLGTSVVGGTEAGAGKAQTE